MVIRAVVIHIHFKTRIAHVSGIGKIGCSFSGSGKYWRCRNHVFGVFQIPVQIDCQRVVEKAQVQSHIGLRGRLPPQVLIARRSQCDTGNGSPVAAAQVIVCVARIYVCTIGSIVITDSGITVLTPTDTDFCICHPFVFREERFRCHTPCRRYGREDAGIVFFGETGGGVTAECCTD